MAEEPEAREECGRADGHTPRRPGRAADSRIIGHFIRRLNAAATRSPLLRLSITARGRLPDCADLTMVQDDLPQRVLTAVVENRAAVSLTLRVSGGVASDPPEEDDEAEIAVTCQRGVACACNKGVAPAPASGKTHLLFADNDLVPVGPTPQIQRPLPFRVAAI